MYIVGQFNITESYFEFKTTLINDLRGHFFKTREHSVPTVPTVVQLGDSI